MRELCEKEEIKNLLIYWLFYIIKGCRFKFLKFFDENIFFVFFDIIDLKLKNFEYIKIIFFKRSLY